MEDACLQAYREEDRSILTSKTGGVERSNS